MVLWIGGVASLAVTTLVTVYATGVGNFLASSTVNPAPGGLPVQIAVRHLHDTGDTHVIPRQVAVTSGDLSALDSLNPTDPAYQAWFQEHQAVDVDATDVELVAEGHRRHTVQIVAIQPVTTCRRPLLDTLFYSPSAGSNETTQLLFDLDRPEEPPGYTDQNGAPLGKDYFATHTVSLAESEQFTFDLDFKIAAAYCQFTLDVTVVDSGKEVVEHVDDNGQPFRVTSMTDRGHTPGEFSAYQALYVGGIVNVDGPTNSFGEITWSKADPMTWPPS